MTVSVQVGADVEVRPLASVASVLVSNVDKLSNDEEIPVRLCNYTDVYKNFEVHPELDLMEATATRAEIARFRLRVGDTVFTKDSETADDIGIPAFVTATAADFICGYHLAIARPDPSKVHPRYLYWWFTSREAAEQWEVRASGVTRVGLRQSDIRSFPVSIHRDLEAQRAIVDFLDRETAQIDAMIEAQRDLVAGLEERRDAVVLQLVRGDSCKWPYRPLKHFVRRVSGSGFPVEEQGIDGLPLPFYKVGALAPAGRDGRIIEVYDTIDHATARRLGAKVVPAGSPVMAKIGAAVLLGRVRQVTQDCCVDNNMVALVTNDLMDDRFAYFALQQFDIKYFVNPGTLPFLNERSLLDAPIPVPSIEEQHAIAAELDRATARMDDMIDAANESIALMQERRAALISAAVTGRVDPRTGKEYPTSEETR